MFESKPIFESAKSSNKKQSFVSFDYEKNRQSSIKCSIQEKENREPFESMNVKSSLIEQKPKYKTPETFIKIEENISEMTQSPEVGNFTKR